VCLRNINDDDDDDDDDDDNTVCRVLGLVPVPVSLTI
jgi:hypothetical protein